MLSSAIYGAIIMCLAKDMHLWRNDEFSKFLLNYRCDKQTILSCYVRPIVVGKSSLTSKTLIGNLWVKL